ncbi:MAG: phosphopentomutase [Deltaproteobacteria bacterium]|nr:phosphopentomutase [Deltaproteobacteria bacterium]
MNDAGKTARARFDKVLWLVLDSVGCGEMPDAAEYGDRGANTLGNTARAVGGLKLPNLGRLGLGNVTAVAGVPPRPAADAHFGRMSEASAGKDTTTGHWEMAGVPLDSAFAVFTDTGFPDEILDAFRRESGFDLIGNVAASGTEIIERLGPEHQRTGRLIVYTSADSVFQIAAHEETVPLPRLYEACRAARRVLDEHRVARVIARPFVGEPGAYKRTYNRADFSMVPPRDTVLDLLLRAGVPVVGVGKIHDIFAGRGVGEAIHTEGNADGMLRTGEALRRTERGLVFTNLVDFDMTYGHRRDAPGYARALEEVDAFLPRLLDAVGTRGLVLVTADHGCDPTAGWSTDHTREYVPLIAWHPGIAKGAGRDLGTRATFADVGRTVADVFGVGPLESGTALPL